jgi:hypothetical protein
MMAPLATYTVVDANEDEVLDDAVMVMTYVLSKASAYAGRVNLEGSKLVVLRARSTFFDLTVHAYFTAARASLDEHTDSDAAERIVSDWDAGMFWKRGPMILTEGRSLSALRVITTASLDLKPKKFVNARVMVYVALVNSELSTVMGW